MNNRQAFIDFVRGLLTISPLERWSPQQAKLHPFITQQKFTGPFIPPMNLMSSSLNRSPAPGTQQQQQAAELSKQRAQAAQAQAQVQAQAAAQAQAQAQAAAQGGYGMQGNQYPQSPHGQPTVYGNNGMYTPGGLHAGAPPPYASQQSYGHGQMVMNQSPAQITPANYAGIPQQPLYQQATVRAGRARASTMDQQQSGVPETIQKVASHLDPSQPIRLQPSPAYYPPPANGMGMADPGAGRVAGRRDSRAQRGGARGGNRDFIRNLEERTLEEGYSGQGTWHS